MQELAEFPAFPAAFESFDVRRVAAARIRRRHPDVGVVEAATTGVGFEVDDDAFDDDDARWFPRGGNENVDAAQESTSPRRREESLRSGFDEANEIGEQIGMRRRTRMKGDEDGRVTVVFQLYRFLLAE